MATRQTARCDGWRENAIPRHFRWAIRNRGLRWVLAGGWITAFAAGCPATQEPLPPRQPLAVWLEKATADDSNERIVALEEMAQYPDQAADVFYPLLEGVISPDSLAQAAALRTIETLAEPLAIHATSLLGSDDPKVLAAACDMISRTGVAGRVALPKLLEMLNSESEQLQTFALFAARNLESDSPELMAQAIKFLDNADFQKQVIALDILRGYGPAAQAAASQVKAVSENGNPSARIHALEALGAIGPVAEFDVVAHLVSRLGVFLQPEREGALKGLGRLGPAAASARDAVERLMNDTLKANQCQAALALWRISGEPRDSLEALTMLGEHVEFEEETVFALAEMGTAAQPAAEFVASKLQSTDDSFRLAVLGVLETIDGVTSAKSKIEELAASDSNVLVRRRAEGLLRNLANR